MSGYLSNKPGGGSTTVTGSGASGQVAFWNGTSSITGENNLFWNATDNFLGIGTTPTVALDVVGSGIFSSNLTVNGGFLSLGSTSTIISRNTNSIVMNGSGLTGLAVGTSSAAVRLDVRRTGSGEIAYFLDSNTHGFITGTSGTTGYLSSSSGATSLAFGINGATDSIYIKTNKYVGIRESNPTAYLQITGQTLYDYLLRVKNTTGDTMLEIRSDMNNSEGILSKYGYMTTQSGKFEVAGAGTLMRGSGLLLYSSSIIQADYYGGGGTLIANFLTDSSKYYANAGAVPSAVLEVYSTTQGFLMPRMTTTQKNAISTPAEALLLFDTDLKTHGFYDTRWKQISETYSDVYTPTLTGVANVGSSTAYECQYYRVGNTVTVSGKIEVTASANNTQTTIGISLPIASNFANSEQLGGTAYTQANSVAGHGGAIYADTGNDRAELDYYETHGATDVFSFHFTYRII